jgi:hypothetical protein
MTRKHFRAPTDIPLIPLIKGHTYAYTVEPLNVEPLNLTYFTLDVKQCNIHSKKGVIIAIIYEEHKLHGNMFLVSSNPNS